VFLTQGYPFFMLDLSLVGIDVEEMHGRRVRADRLF
jgi:hypothetical protein